MKQLYTFITLLFLCFYTGTAQENLKKHTVSHGETLLSISRKYNITLSDLQKANPGTTSNIQENDVLIIPENASNTVHKEGKYHVVQRGETLFGLSNANGLTVDQLVKANSNIISGNLMEGQTIWIPGAGNHTTSSNIEEYLVQNGDTKFSLARRFNTSIAEMERKNPHIAKMLMVGQTIKMPSGATHHTTTPIASAENSTTQTTVPANTVKEAVESVAVAETPSQAPAQKVEKEEAKVVVNESVQKEKETVVSIPVPVEKITPKETNDNLVTHTLPEKVIEEPATAVKEAVQIDVKTPNDGTVLNTTETLALPKITAGFADLRTSANTSTSKKLLFFLPFSEMDYQNHMTNQDHFKNVSDDFKRAHFEFYEGANIAIDSIRKMNLHLEVNVVEAQSANQTSKTKSLIQDHQIKDYDAIILPFYKTVEDEIAAFTANSNIPVITASAIDYKSNTNNLYSALPSVNLQRLKVLNYMMAKQAHIIVLSDANRIESKLFIANNVPKVDFIDIKKNGSFNETELKSKLKKDQLNFVIIDSERSGVFLNTTNTLLSELSNYKIQLAVLEPSLIPDDSDVSQKRYQILKMIFPSLIPAKSTESSKQFLSTYQKKYKLLPSANIMLGFDITFDSLLRLMQQQSFESSALNYMTEYTQLKFNYKKNTLGGYSNEGIYILQYDSDAKIRDAN